MRCGKLPKKICHYSGCNNIISYSEKYCEEHKIKTIEDKQNKNRHYDKKFRDKKSTEFYHSSEWIITSNTLLNTFNRLDIFAYYIQNKIVQANTSHHIIEIKDDWDNRLNLLNLFPVSKNSHSLIHKLYEKDKKGTQELLYKLIDRYNKEFRG